MKNKFYNASDVIDVYMEVSINDDDAIYWIDISNIDSSIDVYDFAIEKAVEYHNAKNKENVSCDNSFAGEPFSRYENEFIFLK